MNFVDVISQTGEQWLGMAWPVVWNLIKIIVLVAPLMICVAYLTLWERKMSLSQEMGADEWGLQLLENVPEYSTGGALV